MEHEYSVIGFKVTINDSYYIKGVLHRGQWQLILMLSGEMGKRILAPHVQDLDEIKNIATGWAREFYAILKVRDDAQAKFDEKFAEFRGDN